ncbi:hypothetical protein D3C72_1101310 [compost metagenome]
MLATVEREDVERHRLFNRGDEDLRGANRHGQIRLLEIGAAHRVVDDIRTMPAGFLPHDVGERLPAGIDHAHRSAGVTTVGLGTALHGEHACAQCGRDLDRGLAYLAIAAANEHRAAGARHAGAAQALIRGDERHPDGTGFQQRQRRRLLAHCVHANTQILAMRAVATNAKLAATAPDLPADPLRGAVDHDACVVAPRRARPYGMRHHAERRLHVAGVHARAGDFDDALARAGLGTRHAGQCEFERVDTGGFLMNLDGIHGDIECGVR